ncbi:MAG TPA: LON peptidase substrate-binding domain-containing protein [Tepidisphaeraceae bacterium]|jgi:Lon protease-like protein|nr:LON peptidase substrate-binding domain-containing protein [Tepidisphaeraceae bacterium]
MHDATSQPSDFSAIPLFPLPNVVLFPCAVLPLHIFEERYKQMTADVLRGHRQIAIALLAPGWEKNYYQRPAIDPVVCIGTILTHEKISDGTYNFLLQGHTRARVKREVGEGEFPYRVAELEIVKQTKAPETVLSEQRQRLISIFDEGTLLATGIGRQFRQLLSSPLPTPDIADLIAFNFLDDVALKQSLLAEGDVARRVTRTVAAFEQAHPALEPASTMGSRTPSLN